MDTDGARIHYLDAGRGPAILFVPGWTIAAGIWEPQIAHFSATHRVIAMDPRSQGRSSKMTDGHYPAAPARDIKAVVDRLRLAPVVLVGWSQAVTELAAYVDRFGTGEVAALVLVDGTAGGATRIRRLTMVDCRRAGQSAIASPSCARRTLRRP